MDYCFRNPYANEKISVRLFELFKLVFGGFSTYSDPSPDWLDWYLQRPGLNRKGIFLAELADELVGNVFITFANLNFDGKIVKAVLIDDVMTHPNHQNRGIATTLLCEALQHAKNKGAQLAFLYTNPKVQPAAYHTYKKLGFLDVAAVKALALNPREYQFPRNLNSYNVQNYQDKDKKQTIMLLNRCFKDFDFFIPINGKLWAWRRESRPKFSPCKTLVLKRNHRIIASATVLLPDFIWKGERCKICLIQDLCIDPIFHGQNLETPIIAKCLDIAKRERVLLCVVYLSDKNHLQLKLFEEMGFSFLDNSDFEVGMFKPLPKRFPVRENYRIGKCYSIFETLLSM